MARAPLSSVHRAALVTGASSGLGLAFARMLLAEGVAVWGTSRDVARLAPLLAHPAFTPLALDLAAPEAAAAIVREADRAAGGFDLVINNAGFGVAGAFTRVPWGEWRAQIDAMLGGTLAIAHVALRGFLARDRGTLVNVSSLAAEFPLPYLSVYNVVKSGLSAFSESALVEVHGTAVRVIDFRPGDFRTEFAAALRTAPSAPEAGAGVSADESRAVDGLRRMIEQGPPVERAVAALQRALRARRSGIVRVGTFFQASLAPRAVRLLPSALKRLLMRVYFRSW